LLSFLEALFIELLVIFKVLVILLASDNHDAGSGSLGRSSSTEILLGRNEDVWNLLILAQDGEMGDNVDW
jgi:hypothetical protein